MEPENLTEFEALFLLAVKQLQPEAYGVPIRRALSRALEREVSPGEVYTTLARLEEQGFVTSYHADPTPKRGGRDKRYVEMQKSGLAALNAAMQQQLIKEQRLQTEGI